MSEKERLELINLRNRLRSQREEIKRLLKENQELRRQVAKYERVAAEG